MTNLLKLIETAAQEYQVSLIDMLLVVRLSLASSQRSREKQP